MDELLADFITETAEHIESAGTQIVLFEKKPDDASLIASIFRLFHTIKGTCGFLGLTRMMKVAHAAETLIGKLREGAPAEKDTVSLILRAIDRIKLIIVDLEKNGEESNADDSDLIEELEKNANHIDKQEQAIQNTINKSNEHNDYETIQSVNKNNEENNSKRSETIRVNINAIERIMQLVSELVLTRNQLVDITGQKADEVIKAPLQRLSSLTTDLQDAVMRARMQPVEKIFASLPRLVRELSSDLGKKINLITDGADTELDRQLIELIRDPLTHMIRNSADHGIEIPEERVKSGKSEFGTIKVSAIHEAGQITIDIVDDGKGLDTRKIREKALQLNLASENELQNMSDEECHRFIFAPGFSTAQKVTNVSGRGVGMDVVRENLSAIGGGKFIIDTWAWQPIFNENTINACYSTCTYC
jgi:two-component system, chemotaxis family, sensor kinase CheA